MTQVTAELKVPKDGTDEDVSNSKPSSSTELYIEKIRRNELSIFEEATESTLGAAHVFAVADIRALAYRGVIPKEDAAEVLKLPMDGEKLRELEKKHEKHWKKFRSRDFTSLADAYRRKNNVSKSLVVHYVGDENSDKECVHCIGRHAYRGVITCVFRGSVTPNDWVQDIKLMIDKVPNPLAGVDGQPDMVGIHWGFRNYIHGDANKLGKALTRLAKSVPSPSNLSERSNGTNRDASSDSLIDSKPTRMEIVLQQLRTMKKKYPNDVIYVVGHSLGGALSLVAALNIAADPELGKLPADAPPGVTPVTCCTIGNPKPGDGDFCNAMEYLERIQRLRCCVVHNTWDVVPMLATNVARSQSGFWQPGWRVLLYRDRCEIGRGRNHTSQIQEEAENPACTCCCCRCCCCRKQDSESMWNLPKGFNPVQAAKRVAKNKHDHRVYLERLVIQENQLRKLKLNDLYQEMWDTKKEGVDNGEVYEA